ncbi:hypothetical protein [Aquibacillus saliphilus]|uniref:hypothetical protein n=1 Tax=Aquibacillus saliphilus TaxID=1909422 RepID=UPI001CF0A367|nr:hypothetical protein [Aquibacillus saliphilus]
MDKMDEFFKMRIDDLEISIKDHKNLSHDEYVFLKGQSDELITLYNFYLKLKKEEKKEKKI